MRSDRRTVAVTVFVASFAAVGIAVLWGCATEPTPRNGWDEGRLGPLVPHTNFPGDCGLCHVADRWDTLREDFAFDHAKETGVPLEGAHARAACLRCHNDRGPVRIFLARGCGGCHVDPHESSLDLDCTECHDQISWVPTGLIAKHQRTRFPLYAAHLGAACDRCHPQATQGYFLGAPLECELCHQDDLARAQNPDHVGLGWIRDCQRCHSPTIWGDGNFDHGEFFPIDSGPHQRDCIECHTTGDTGTFSCIDCHAHTQPEMDDKHSEVPGYVYASPACLQCHPDGRN